MVATMLLTAHVRPRHMVAVEAWMSTHQNLHRAVLHSRAFSSRLFSSTQDGLEKNGTSMATSTAAAADEKTDEEKEHIKAEREARK